MTVEAVHTVTEQDVADFARVSGDYNPLHMDEAYAKSTEFGGRIAHGALTASYVSAILGNQLPGPGSIFIDLQLKFRAPVRIGDDVIARATVKEKLKRGNFVVMGVQCEVDGKIAVKGEARVIVPSKKAG